jgi:hypothetical protein
LTKAKESGNGFVFVKQGSADPKKLPLPNDPAPIPHPVFVKWNLGSEPSGETLEAYGLDFGSISEIESSGVKLNFKVSDDGRTLKLSDHDRLEELRFGKPFEVRLKNGERMQEIVSPALTKNSSQ